MGRQTDLGKVTSDACRVGFGDHAELRGKFRRQHHADGNAFAMEQAVGKAGGGLKRMPEGMTEIEQCALAGLALVAGHDRGLCRAAVANAPSRAPPPAEKSAWVGPTP